jgi:polysaccharide export outer membrane protein
MRTSRFATCLTVLVCGPGVWSVAAQAPPVARPTAQTAVSGAPTGNPAAPAGAVIPPPDYVIGPDDQLSIVFWRDKDLSSDVVVRPDGKITLPLLNDVQAAGLTPDALRGVLTQAATKFVEEPNVSVAVKQINSRKVFITGQVGKPSPYPLNGPMTVVQLISLAGGLLEYADEKNVRVLRTENGASQSFRVNYDELKKGRNLQQNIELKPGDQVLVP